MHIKIIHNSRIISNGPKMKHCYSQLQIHAVHMLTSHARCLVLLTHDSVLLIWSPRMTNLLRRPDCMKFILCFGPQNTRLKYGCYFHKHPVYMQIFPPQNIAQGAEYTYYSKLRKDLGNSPSVITFAASVLILWLSGMVSSWQISQFWFKLRETRKGKSCRVRSEEYSPEGGGALSNGNLIKKNLRLSL